MAGRAPEMRCPLLFGLPVPRIQNRRRTRPWTARGTQKGTEERRDGIGTGWHGLPDRILSRGVKGAMAARLGPDPG